MDADKADGEEIGSNRFERVLEGFGPALYWLPVWLGVGTGLYFSLPDEPKPALSWLVTFLLITLFLWVERGIKRTLIGAIAAISAGFSLAVLRTEVVAAPVLERETRTIMVSAVIMDLERFAPDHMRLVLEAAEIQGLRAEDTPKRLRLTLRGVQPALAPGDRIKVLARLQPPRPPDIPGGFDYPRHAFFERLGGIGFAVAPAQILARDEGRISAHLGLIRDKIAARIRAQLPGDEGAFLSAILVGRRDGLSDKAQEDLRASGLMHILSISGLHMGMVAAAVFGLVRALLAAIPPLARARDVRKIAAISAMIVVTLYLLLSDLSVPPVRSWLMVMLGLVAVTFLRRPFSLRLVALAAAAVLVFEPDALFKAGFQMSFAATIALVGGFEAISAFRSGKRAANDDAGPTRMAAMWIVRYAGLLVATTVIASLATAPFSLYHFGRASLFGVGANALIVPLMGVFLMPLGLIALILMPFGAEACVLDLLKPGLSAVLDTAAAFAAGGVGSVEVPAFAASVLALFAFGGLLIILARQWPHRAFGLALMAASGIWAMSDMRPRILVSANMAVAWIDDEGHLASDSLVRGKGALERWVIALGSGEPKRVERVKGKDPGPCDRQGCWITVAGKSLAIARDPDALLDDCARADILINATSLPLPCERSGLTISRENLARSGATAIYIDKGDITMRTVAGVRGSRPWSDPAKFHLTVMPEFVRWKPEP